MAKPKKTHAEPKAKTRATAEEKQIHKAHDLFLKATFIHLWAIQAFFRAYIPAYLRKSVDFDSIRPIRESHILSSLKKLENDLIFTCKINGRLAILIIEHVRHEVARNKSVIQAARLHSNLSCHYFGARLVTV